MDHNKKSGNDPIEVKYKAEVEEILDGNHPSLTPKLLESSLNQNNEVNIEKEALFNEITGRSKRKNSSFNTMQFMDTLYTDTLQINHTHSLQIDHTRTSQINCTYTSQIDCTRTSQIDCTCTLQIDCTCTPQIDPLQFE
ncbi:unnamed protein product [Rhizophagus irregularis]|nr:unnamed protein product [Rhizophagus irregularis]